MDFVTIIKSIIDVGFPVVFDVLLLAFIKYIYDENNKTLKNKEDKHKEEVDKLSNVINNNTLIMQRLYDKLGGTEND